MTRHFLLFVFLFNASCSFLKNSDKADNKTADPTSQTTSSADGTVKNRAASEIFERPLREAIYFANSLEREALKLIQRNDTAQNLTLFSVLSYVVESKSGVKKSLPFGLDCGQYEMEKGPSSVKVLKACVRPQSIIAEIRTIIPEKEFQVEFFVREWPTVVGLSVSLTGQNIVCDMKVNEKKLDQFQCRNWSYQVAEEQTSSTVIKADVFLFQRHSAQQLVIRGGFFKDLTENKKIDIQVPLEGKIRIIEKELEVIDEFLNEKEGTDEQKEKQKESFKKVETQNGQIEASEIEKSQIGEEILTPDFIEPQVGEEVDSGQQTQIPEAGEGEPVPSSRGGRGR